MANVSDLKLCSAKIIKADGTYSERKAFVMVDGEYYLLDAIKRQPKTPKESIDHVLGRTYPGIVF